MALGVGTGRPGASGWFGFGPHAVASPDNGTDDSPTACGMEKLMALDVGTRKPGGWQKFLRESGTLGNEVIRLATFTICSESSQDDEELQGGSGSILS